MKYSFKTPFWCYISVGGHPGVTSIQGGILADYNQNLSRGWDSPDTKFQLPQWLGTYVPLTLYVEILFWANTIRTPYWLTWCHVSPGRHIGWLQPNWYTCPEVKSCHVWLSQVSSHSSYRWLRYSFKTPFWCYMSVGGHPGVTSVQGGILADYDQNFSRGWDSPDKKFQLPQWPEIYVPLTLYVEILFWTNALRTPYWLTWCHVSSGRHIGWLRPNWYPRPEVKSCQVWLSWVFSHSSYTWLRYSFKTPFWCYISVGGHPGVTSIQGGILADYNQNLSRGWDSPDTKFQLPQWLGTYVPLTLYVEILFWANTIRTPYWLTWCHVSPRRHIGWLQPNWYPCPEVKSCHVWLSQVSSHSSYRWLRYSFKTPFWCYMSVGGHPGVTSAKGGIFADYDQNFSRGWDSPDTKFQLPEWPGI